MTNESQREYRGKRALMLLRVSTPEQEKGFGWPSQEREIRRKLIEPLGLRLDEERHIIKDTYTGLEFRNRPVLEQILEMAQRREFDLLVTDVLDRLGRKGLERELYRMQLREYGVRILTTDPNDHADDDTFTGELIRLIKGYQAEEELNNFRRRSMNGVRTKIEGDKVKGIEPQVLGNGHRYYGYKYALNERGKRTGLVLNHDVIRVDEDGTEWTEVKIVIFIFESAANGVALRQICILLNEMQIPSPYVAKGITGRHVKYTIWKPCTIGRFIRQSAYWGEARFNKKPVAEKEPGKKVAPRKRTAESEQIVVSVPTIVTKELAEAAQGRVAQNRKFATHNNQSPEETLLRSGLALCGHCGHQLRVNHKRSNWPRAGEKEYWSYYCPSGGNSPGICRGCSISTSILDELAWKKAVEIINDAKEIDKRVERERSADPTADRRKNLNAMLKQIRDEQAALQDFLSEAIRKRTLDSRTEARLTKELGQLAEQEEKCESMLAGDMDEYEKWKKVQKKSDELHQECVVMRERMRDPNYEPDYQKKHELLAFFGITVKLFHKDHKPRIQVECNPPDIVARHQLMVQQTKP
jgi:site-specific DNA recombinase